MHIDNLVNNSQGSEHEHGVIYLIRKCFVSVQDEFSFLEYIICSVKTNFIINIFKNVVYYFKYNFF